MGFGQLRCIGTQMHLKNKFGDGFKLTLNCSRDGQDVSALLDDLCPGARLVHSCVSLCLCVSVSLCLCVSVSLCLCSVFLFVCVSLSLLVRPPMPRAHYRPMASSAAVARL